MKTIPQSVLEIAARRILSGYYDSWQLVSLFLLPFTTITGAWDEGRELFTKHATIDPFRASDYL